MYRRSIDKHVNGYTEKVKAVWDQIPGELQKHEKKFRLASLGEGARYRSYESSFLWLKDARFVNICNGVTEPQVGMRLKRDDRTFKCYMGDTGLLISHAFVASGHSLYFYSNYSTVSEDRMEVDFLVEKPTLTNAHNICPVEVKSGKYSSFSSLSKFREKFKKQLHAPYIIYTQDYKEENGYVFLPIYMTPLL
mgnify:CR=1 FL=1